MSQLIEASMATPTQDQRPSATATAAVLLAAFCAANDVHLIDTRVSSPEGDGDLTFYRGDDKKFCLTLSTDYDRARALTWIQKRFTEPLPAELTAAEELLELLDEHDAEMVVGELDGGMAGFGLRLYGRLTLVFPEGQDPAVRLAHARLEIARLEAAAAARLTASDPCDKAWCKETGDHRTCGGPVVYLPARSWEADPGFPVPSVLAAQLLADREDGTTLSYDRGGDNWRQLHSGDELRAETAKVRAHLARLDALADQFDAIREAGGAVPAPAAASEHFLWCAPGGCLTHDGAATEHESAWNTLPNRGRHPGRTGPLLKSALNYSADLGDSPEVGVSFLDEGTTYTGPEADALIADLETFLAGLKAQRALLGEKPAAR